MPVQEGEHELLEEPVEERQEVSFRNQFLIFSVRDHIYIYPSEITYIYPFQNQKRQQVSLCNQC